MLKKLLVWLLLPVLFSFTAFIAVRLPSPKTKTLYLPGSSSKIDLTRDSLGIPHISAETAEEAVYGLGYAMCEDRMWQIDMMRRLATGQLSEMFGIDALETDMFMRNVKLAEMGLNDTINASERTKVFVGNFVRGINDAAANSWLPLEYYLVNHKWKNFTEAESQSMLYLTSFFLSMLWGNDVLKVQVKEFLGEFSELVLPTRFELINPRTFIVGDDELADELLGIEEELLKSNLTKVGLKPNYFDQGSGSNGWVISGNHTLSGKPILSNDPHLSSSIPSLWYLNHLNISGKSLFGVNSVGYPMSAIGRTEKFVWGITASKVDDVDIYEEKPINDTHYIYNETFLKFDKKLEIIQIKGQKSAGFYVKSTIHGPLLEKTLKTAKKFVHTLPDVESENLSFAWTCFGHLDRSMDFSYKIHEVDSIHEFRDLMKGVSAIKLGVVAGSSNGDILYQATGRSPLRGAEGDQVLPGWDPRYTWKGIIPFEAQPYSLNPKKGFIVAANNFITSKSYKNSNSLGHYFCQGRADRLTQFFTSKIQENHKFTSKDQILLLQDEFDIFASETLPVLLSKLKNSSKITEERKILQEWDFIMSRESKAAGLYANWLLRISSNLLSPHLPEGLLQSCIRSNIMQYPLTNFFLPFYPSLEGLCDDPKTESVESCEELIQKSFEEAVGLSNGRVWGEIHEVTLRQNPFSMNKWVRWFFERKMIVGGWGTTVHAISSNWAVGLAGNNGPGVKFVADLGNQTEGFWSLESGMSGNALGRHYDDMFSSFHYGELPRFVFH
jgi:penicillin amidase